MKRMFINPGKILTSLLAGMVLLMSCEKEVTITPKVNAIDPGAGAGNAVITVQGSGLKNIQSIVFDMGNVSASFNPNFNTDETVIFRVPIAANVGQQNIVFTTAGGYQFSVPFEVLAVPSITSAFPAEWEADDLLTINGNYLDGVTDVTLEGTTDKAEVVSAEPTKLVIKMPASEKATTKLVITNAAGSTTTDILFVNMDKQFKFFTEALPAGMENWSWCAASTSTDFAVSGTTSFKAVYTNGGFQGLSFRYGDPITAADYQFLSFWIKGGTEENIINVIPDAVSSGTAVARQITVPANVWTKFTMPVSGNFDGIVCQRLNFQIEGPEGSDQTLYFDNVIFVK